MLPITVLCAALLLAAPADEEPTSPTPDDSRAELSVEIEGAIDAVWRAFSTAEGLCGWMAPQVEIDLRIGGKMRSHYDAAGTLGDESTIESTILSYDPGRMISLKATKLPEGFPFVEAARGTWSVFYFEPVSDTRTKITMVGLGYTDDPQSQTMRRFFSAANTELLRTLERSLAAEAAEEAADGAEGATGTGGSGD